MNWPTPGHERVPDVVGSIPVESGGEYLREERGKLECRTVCICDSKWVSVTPGGLGGKGSLRVLGSMVKIGCR